nr:MAG TPA: hypothetical protein [Caudoviricetes sp.]
MVYSTGKGSAASTRAHYGNRAPVSHSGGQSGQDERLAVVVVIPVNNMRIYRGEPDKRRDSAVHLTGKAYARVWADLSHNRRNTGLSISFVRTGKRVIVPIIQNNRTRSRSSKSRWPLNHCALHLLSGGSLYPYHLSIGINRFINISRHYFLLHSAGVQVSPVHTTCTNGHAITTHTAQTHGSKQGHWVTHRHVCSGKCQPDAGVIELVSVCRIPLGPSDCVGFIQIVIEQIKVRVCPNIALHERVVMSHINAVIHHTLIIHILKLSGLSFVVVIKVSPVVLYSLTLTLHIAGKQRPKRSDY